MNKQLTIRLIAKRSGLTYSQAAAAVEALIAVWSKALAEGEQIAIEHFLSMEYRAVVRTNTGQLTCFDGKVVKPAQVQYRLMASPSQHLRKRRKP
jgi:hypothetical protein